MRQRLISAEELTARMLGNRNAEQLGSPPPAALTGPTLYQQLQLDPSAEPDVIEAAYKRLALRYHPDRDRSPEAGQRMQVINEARRVLSDPEQRERYDRSIGLSPRPSPPPRPPQPRPAQGSAPESEPAPKAKPEPPQNSAPRPAPDRSRGIRADDV
jgi:curved DNA-binding protein CbpA